MAITGDLDIVNAACALLSVDPLQSMSDDVPGGQAAQALYWPVVDLCLGLAPWGFARRRRQLARLSTVTSPLGFAHVHQLPPDRVGLPERLFEAGVPGGSIQAFDYDEEARVHSDVEDLWAEFTCRVVPSMWHPVFRTAVIHAVAAVFCEPLTGNSAMTAELHARAFGTPSESYRGGLMRAALSADARATPARMLPSGSNPLLVAWNSDGTRFS